jgi:hypothetical protein
MYSQLCNHTLPCVPKRGLRANHRRRSSLAEHRVRRSASEGGGERSSPSAGVSLDGSERVQWHTMSASEPAITADGAGATRIDTGAHSRAFTAAGQSRPASRLCTEGLREWHPQRSRSALRPPDVRDGHEARPPSRPDGASAPGTRPLPAGCPGTAGRGGHVGSARRRPAVAAGSRKGGATCILPCEVILNDLH